MRYLPTIMGTGLCTEYETTIREREREREYDMTDAMVKMGSSGRSLNWIDLLPCDS